MQFDYEIPVEEYVSAQVLYYRAYAKGRIVRRALVWVLLGLFFVLIPLFQWVVAWERILLLLMGSWCVYAGIASLYPTRYYRHSYPESGLAGKKYHADLDEYGFSVSGDSCSWQAPWTDVQHKGEDKRVFMLSGKATIFMFGKKYLTDEQQREIRQFCCSPMRVDENSP
jgi:hypothetical protein